MDEYTQTNIGGTATLLQCLIDRGQELDRLVLASSRAVYGEGKYACTSCGTVYPQSRSIDQLDAKEWEPICPRCSGPVSSMPTDESTPPKPSSIYAITKKAQEELVLCAGQAFGLPVVILRYFNVYGSRQSPFNPYTGVIATFLSRLAAGQPLELYEDGQMKRDFVHVRDMVGATIAAAETAEAVGQVINVGSGEATTIAQMAGALTEITGTTQPTRQIDVARVGDVRHVVADISLARELLGYESKVSIYEGLAETVDWFRGQGEQVDKSDHARQELEEHNLLRQ
jgi:dTDP-L-rhamnose 4-epimerase